jgi:DNA-binding response OmpR family regulator
VTRILLADDDVELCELLAEYLQGEDFEVETVHDGAAAVQAVRERVQAIVVLDVMMPGMNGFDALREIRTSSTIPVLMLTARGDDVDRIVGLEMGADDYLAKPCNPRELVARIRAILRRASGRAQASGGAGAIEVAGIVLDPARRTTRIDDAEVALTATEFNLLRALMERAGRVVTKEALCELALNRKLERFDRSVDVHVSNLRKKLGPARGGGRRIRAVRGIGYVLAELL